MKRLNSVVASVLALGLASLAWPAMPQETYPSRPIKIVVGYPPGGFPDTVTRLFADALGRNLHNPVIVENRPSAGTLVAGNFVANSAPDGYTLLSADSQMWGISPLLYRNMPFDPFGSFEPVSMMATTSNFIIVSSDFPAQGGFKEVLAHLKANPGRYRYGSAGIGSLHHITMEMFKAQTGAEMEHLPFKGSSQILPALFAGEVAIAVQALASLPAYVKQGKVRVLAVASSTRSAQMPDIPTLEELGVPEMSLLGSLALLAPRQTPKPVIDRIAAAVKAATKDPALVEKLTAIGVDPVGSSPAELGARMKDDVALYRKAAEAAKLKAE